MACSTSYRSTSSRTEPSSCHLYHFADGDFSLAWHRCYCERGTKQEGSDRDTATGWKPKRFVNSELIADIEVRSSELHGCELDADMAKLMIDEYPILSIAACFAESPSIFKGLKELIYKESNRLELIRLNLNNCGVDCKVINDQLYINPKKKYTQTNNIIQTDFDHRIAMSFAIMGSKLENNLEILNSESIKTSFPNFIEIYNKVGGNLIE